MPVSQRSPMPLINRTASTPLVFTRSTHDTIAAFTFRTWAITFLILGAATLDSCKSGKEAAQPVATPAVSNKSVDEPNKNIPPDIFKAMPMYPGATIDHVRKPRGAMREILFSTPDQLAQIVAFYKDELKKADFHVTSALIMPARKTWSCEFHKSGRPATLNLYPDDADKSRMTIELI